MLKVDAQLDVRSDFKQATIDHNVVVQRAGWKQGPVYEKYERTHKDYVLGLSLLYLRRSIMLQDYRRLAVVVTYICI